ncbi:MAG: NAD+ synthase [bacterium]
MKISLHQINTTVGDFSGNAQKIIAGAKQAGNAGVTLAIFPELCLTGYPPLDLIENRPFTDMAGETLNALLGQTANLETTLIIGTIAPIDKPGEGKDFQNAAVVIHRGRITAIHRKILLPTYDVFEESRNFEPGDQLTPIQVAGDHYGISICEDVWNDKTFWRERLYHMDPVEDYMAKTPSPLINIAASPYSQGKGNLRLQMLSNIARRYKVPVFYVNMVGGNDSLVFDGRSMVLNENGDIVAIAEGFEEQMITVDLDDLPKPVENPPPLDDLDTLLKALVTGLRDYAAKCGFPSAVLGLSGGIDSALTAVLAVRALGAKNVLGVLMQSPYTAPESIEDALSLASNLGIETKTIPISGIYSTYLEDLKDGLDGLPADVTEENIQARIRGNILMALSNRFGYLVLSTGNKSELATGYCTLYGDMSGGLAVISDLYKGEVYRLSEHINRDVEIIPRRIITKEPSAELKPGQKDSDSLPPYDILDPILKGYIEDHKTPEELVAAGYDKELVIKVLNSVEGNEYKRQQASPGIKVSWKAFGLGRRYPIAKAKLF